MKIKKKYYQVFWDETNGYPYVIFNGYKMYYPKQTEFVVLDGKQYIINAVENEQYSGSPHLYLTDSHMLKNDYVIIDAGVAEGNFTLANYR